jgi:hypothetical protein
VTFGWPHRPDILLEPSQLATALQGHQQLKELQAFKQVTGDHYLELSDGEFTGPPHMLAPTPTSWDPAAWALLAALPALERAALYKVSIDASAPAAAALHTLECERGWMLMNSAEQLPGCLALQLPQVQRMQPPCNLDVMQLATALQGHQHWPRELHCAGKDCSAAAWALLAALPRLETLHATLTIDASAPAAAALHQIECSGAIRLQHTQQQLPGCLARQLPQQQHLQAGCAHLSALAAALQGHQQLQHLHTVLDDASCGPDPGQQHEVLADLASCSRLQVLYVPAKAATAEGCAALAAGACRHCISFVELLEGTVEPACLAPLLSAAMPAMQHAIGAFTLDAGGRNSASVQQVAGAADAGGRNSTSV